MLKIRRISIKVKTKRGDVGTEFGLSQGLVVICAPNSSGKSTCLNAIIYVLGLEGMFGPARRSPLSPAITNSIIIDGDNVPVLETELFLEIQNGNGEILTVRRLARDGEEVNLVTVWEGPKLSSPETEIGYTDYYVRIPGSNINPRGFHLFLAKFIGWELPEVAKFEGADGILYMECIFPLLFVEQKYGWSVIEGRFPTHYGIRNLTSQVISFLLNLDTNTLASLRVKLQEEATILRAQWANKKADLDGVLIAGDAIVQGLPSVLANSTYELMVPQVQVSLEGNWRPLREVIALNQGSLKELKEREIPIVNDVLSSAKIELESAENRLFVIEQLIEKEVGHIEMEKLNQRQLRFKLTLITEDLVKYQDAKKLKKLGSVEELHLSSGHCPTCRQEISDTILSSGIDVNVMSIEHNIDFLNEQKKFIEFVSNESIKSVSIKERYINSMYKEAEELRAKIRALKETLTSHGNMPSVADLEMRLRLQEKIRLLQHTNEKANEKIKEMLTLIQSWNEFVERRKKVPNVTLTAVDRRKLALLQRKINNQLDEYGFKSTATSSVTVSEENFTLLHEGYNLQLGLSASDTIRAAWAFKYGLMEVAREEQTNHLGLLLMDEPRQQEVDEKDFRVFLKRLSESMKADQQVIVTTSRTRAEINQMLNGIPNHIVFFDAEVLQPL